MKPRYLQEFPDYDDTLPTLEGFHDSSYHNDTCPSLFKMLDEKEEKYIQIYCDYKDINLREWDDMQRFTVYMNDLAETTFQTDNWEEIVQFIKALNVLSIISHLEKL